MIHEEDFQAVDIVSTAGPVTKMAVTVPEAAQVPGVFQQVHLMRSGRPGPVLIDLPVDVQLTEIEFDPDPYEADASELLVEVAELTGVPVVPTLMGWGVLPDDHELGDVVEFEEVATEPGHAPTSIRPLQVWHGGLGRCEVAYRLGWLTRIANAGGFVAGRAHAAEPQIVTAPRPFEMLLANPVDGGCQVARESQRHAVKAACR